MSVVIAGEREALAVSTPSVYDNYQNFPIGSRAAGMGGAYTALACDEAALHYNPAALSCAAYSHLELVANAYVLDALSVPNAFGKGQDISAISFHSVPSIVGGVRILNEGDEATRVGRLAFGITVSVPASIAIKADPANPTQKNYIAFSGRDDVTAGDIGLGYQLTRELSLGLSIGAVLRTFESHLSALLAGPATQPCAPGVTCHSFVAETIDEELTAVGGRARLGVRYAPTPELSFGLTATTPTLDVYGTGSASETVTGALGLTDATGTPQVFYDGEPIRLNAKSNVGFPLRFAVGAAYSTPHFAAALDVSVNVPRDTHITHDTQQQKIKGGTPATDEELADVVYHLGWQPNVSAGVEIGLAKSFAMDLGAFTDLSSVTDQDAKSGIRDKVNMYGGSVALGVLGTQSRGWFGVSFEYGQGDTKVPSGSLTLQQAIETGLPETAHSTVTRWTLVGHIGSNYSFLPDKIEQHAPPAAQPSGQPGAQAQPAPAQAPPPPEPAPPPSP